MNVKYLMEELQNLDLAGNGNTVVEIVTNTGAIKQIREVKFSAVQGAIQIIVR